jgi:hypothetical protein
LKTAAVASFVDLLTLEKTDWKDERDTVFVALRKGIEIIIGFYNTSGDISLKDESRKVTFILAESCGIPKERKILHHPQEVKRR